MTMTDGKDRSLLQRKPVLSWDDAPGADQSMADGCVR